MMKLSLQSFKTYLGILTFSSSLLMANTPSLAVSLTLENSLWNLQQLDIFYSANTFSYFQDFGEVAALLNINKPNQIQTIAANTDTNNYNFDPVATVGQKPGNFLEKLFSSLTDITIGKTSSNTSNARLNSVYKKYDVIGLRQTDSSRVFEDIYDFDKKVNPHEAVLVDPNFVRRTTLPTNSTLANNTNQSYTNQPTPTYQSPERLTFSQLSSTVTAGSAPAIVNNNNNYLNQKKQPNYLSNQTNYQNPYLTNIPNPYQFKPQTLPQSQIYQKVQQNNNQWTQQQLNQQKQIEQQQRQLIQQQQRQQLVQQQRQQQQLQQKVNLQQQYTQP